MSQEGGLAPAASCSHSAKAGNLLPTGLMGRMGCKDHFAALQQSWALCCAGTAGSSEPVQDPETWEWQGEREVWISSGGWWHPLGRMVVPTEEDGGTHWVG